MHTVISLFHTVFLCALVCTVCMHAAAGTAKNAGSAAAAATTEAGKPCDTEIKLAVTKVESVRDDAMLMSYITLEPSEKAETTFTTSLKTDAADRLFFNLPLIEDSPQIMVEMKFGRLAKAYVDLNMNGKLEKKEELTPGKDDTVLTPEFTLKRQDGTKTPYAFRLMVYSTGALASPMRVWRGEGVLNSERVTVVMKDADMSGSPGDTGKDQVRITSETPGPYGRPGFIPFSSIIKYKNNYYKTTYTDVSPALNLNRCDIKTGKLKVQLPLEKNIETTLLYGSVVGGKDTRLAFNIRNQKELSIELPAAEYFIPMLYITFKDKQGDDWYAITYDRNTSRLINLQADTENIVALGKPAARVTAVEQKNRAKTPDAVLAECKQGDILFLNIKLVGENGEEYAQVSRRKDPQPVYPVLKILDPKGKEIASKSMEYG